MTTEAEASLSLAQARAWWTARWPLNDCSDLFWLRTLVAHSQEIDPELIFGKGSRESVALVDEDLRREFGGEPKRRARGNPQLLEARARAQCIAEWTAWVADQPAPSPTLMGLAEIVLGVEPPCRNRRNRPAVDEWRGRVRRLQRLKITVDPKVLEAREEGVYKTLQLRREKERMSPRERAERAVAFQKMLEANRKREEREHDRQLAELAARCFVMMNSPTLAAKAASSIAASLRSMIEAKPSGV